MASLDLCHYGIKGMKWGVRRYQNSDGTLTEAGKARLKTKDTKWARKNQSKITNTAYKKASKELSSYRTQLLNDSSSYTTRGKVKQSVISAYNQKAARLMSSYTSDITSPSGKTVQFVAKRGSVGVYMALADQGYNISSLKNGVWSSGRVAYRKDELEKI